MHSWAIAEPGAQATPFNHAANLTKGQVIVDVQSCSLTRGDVGFADNRWGGTPYPIVPGLEVIGTVREPNGSEFNAGDVVGACFNCEYCKAGKEQFCPEQKLIPLQAKGGLGDALIVDSRFAFPMPEILQQPEATPLLCAGLTVFSAIKRARLEAGMNAAVVGIGSLGHLAIRFLSKMGCEVGAFTGDASKAAVIRGLGASSVTIMGNDTKLPNRTYDAVFVTSAGEIDWQAWVEALKPEGSLCIVGLPPNPIRCDADALADLAARRITGSYIGSRQDMRDMLAFAAVHNITARAKIFPMNEINSAFAGMRSRHVPFSAVLVNS